MPTTDPVDAAHWLRLALTAGLSPVALRALLSEFGAPEAVLAAPRSALRKLVAPELAAAISDGGNQDAAKTALVWLAEPGNHLVTLGDREYPQLLLQSADPP